MKTDRFKIMLVVFAVLLFAGCAGQQVKSDMPPFTPVALEREASLKVSNFLVIMDTSASMNELYRDISKFDLEKEVMSRMNQTIAGLDVKGALRAFGQGKDTTLLYGLTEYTASCFEEGLDTATHADGNSPLYAAVNGAGNDLQTASGNIALIIFSDAKKVDKASALASVNKIKKAFGDRICIYTVLIGNDKDGVKLMKEVAEAGECGFATNADDILGAQEMADFSRAVFFGGPAGWVLVGVEFEFGSSSITADSYSSLDESVKILRENPSVNVRLDGHTDNIGGQAYNQKLSEDRAKAVMGYFIEKGISADRLSSAGYGHTRPIASNETPAGRSKNRRVELTIVK